MAHWKVSGQTKRVTSSFASSSSTGGRGGVDSVDSLLLSSSNIERGSCISRNRPTTRTSWQDPESWFWACKLSGIKRRDQLPAIVVSPLCPPCLPLATCDKQILPLLHIYLSHIFAYQSVSSVNWHNPNTNLRLTLQMCIIACVFFGPYKLSLKWYFDLSWLHICGIFIIIHFPLSGAWCQKT